MTSKSLSIFSLLLVKKPLPASLKIIVTNISLTLPLLFLSFCLSLLFTSISQHPSVL